MRVLIDTFGTRGDVQPYLALARGFQRAGHDARLAAPEQFASLSRELVIPFAPFPGDLIALLDTPEGKSAIAGSKGFGAGFRLLNHVRPHMRALLDAEWRAAEDVNPDVIVCHPKSLGAPHIAERLQRPCFLASPLPGFTPTSAFPSPLLPFKTLGPFNRLSHKLLARSGSALFRGLLRKWRHETLKLEQAPDTSLRGTIYAYSKQVIPRPADWGDDVLVSGFWFLEQPEWAPDDRMAAFLGEGAPPVYVGFGSMPALRPQRLTATVVEALARTRKRGLLIMGNEALDGSVSGPHVHYHG